MQTLKKCKPSAFLLSYSLMTFSLSLATSLNKINTSQDIENSLKESLHLWRCDTGSQKYFTINFAKIKSIKKQFQ